MKKILSLALSTSTLLASGLAQAEVTGSIGLSSEYLYRGFEQSKGMAVIGTADWQAENGGYLGFFAANNAALGDTEVNVLGGWKFALGESSNLDVGAVYYLFTEEDENGAPSSDYYEAYVSLGLGALTAAFYYTPEYSGDATDVDGRDQDAYYGYVDYTMEICERMNLRPQVGYSYGDGIETSLGDRDHYYDYSLDLSYDMDNGYTANFTAVDTTLPGDEVKFVAAVTKAFSF